QSNGEPAWSFAPRFTVDGVMNYATTPIVSNSVVMNGTVIIGANGTIYALNAQTVEVPSALEQKTTESIFPKIPTSWYVWILIALIAIIVILYAVFRKKE
ncbi:MAG: PQQ-binding-like beta-propeller repeat protein, partial [Thermoplasmata archaeon]|nr:PQQ-binding-like beta-propeller repeat protein [Thermoplasmata archaeon]